MDYREINAIVLANYVDKAKPAFRIVIVYDYAKVCLYQLVEDNTDYEYVLSKNTDFTGIEKLSLVTIEISDIQNKEDTYFKYYKNKSIICHANNINLKKTMSKVADVMKYRKDHGDFLKSMCVIEKGDNLFKKRFYWHIGFRKNTIEVFSLENTKIMLDKKNGKPKFLYKKDNGEYYHLFIQDPDVLNMVNENFTGLIVLRSDSKGILRIISLLGDVKSDELVEKEKFMRKLGEKEREEKRVEKNRIQEFYNYKSDAEKEFDYLYKCVEKKYGYHEELVFDNKIEDIDSPKRQLFLIAILDEGGMCNVDYYGYSYIYIDDYEIICKTLFKNEDLYQIKEYVDYLKIITQYYDYDEEKFEFAYKMLDFIIGNRYTPIDSRSLLQIKKEDFGKEISEEREKGLAEYLKSKEDKDMRKIRVNSHWKNFFKFENNYVIPVEKVFLVDDFRDLTFATNFEKIDIEEKLKLFPELEYTPLD